MDSVRYWLAWLLVVFLPPAFLYWFVVHPFARFWRRVGRGMGVMAAFGVLIGGAVALGQVARGLLVTEYGFSWPLTVAGLGLLGLAIAIQIKRGKLLTMRILMGVPEVSGDPGASKLLTEGIYSRVRHPRYIEVVAGSLGYALIANYLAGYVTVAVCVVFLWLLVEIEERELRERFGSEWDDYAARTPRFVPRRIQR